MIPSYALCVRRTAAGLIAVFALVGAVYFGSLRLDSHGNYPVCTRAPDLVLISPCAPATRGVWEFALAVAIGGLGVVAAVGVARRG